MNTIESNLITNPDGVIDECARFVIDDVGSPFILSDITTINTRYVFSFWVKSSSSGNLLICGETIESSTDWKKHTISFTAVSRMLSIRFLDANVYYIYHPKLEIGTMTTDWTPAPEDLDHLADDMNDLNNTVNKIYQDVATLSIENGSIVTSIEKVFADISDAKNKLSSIENDGVVKVTTTTGRFDHEGLTIDNTSSPTKTQITPDGMTVYSKNANNETTELLVANSDGVDATNLHANTYLIVGERSRFENYGNNRTGCFWIGG